MQLEKKRAITIIAVFVVGLAAFSTAYIRSQLGPKPSPLGRSRTTLVVEQQPHEAVPSLHRQYDDYQIIGKRNLFARPPDKAESSRSLQSDRNAKAFFPGPGKAALPVFPPSFAGRGERGGFSRGTGAPSIAATGIVQLGGTPFVLLEQVDRGETALIQVDEKAFGYTLVSIDDETVTLHGRGGTLTLKLGDNKQDKAPEPAKAAEPPPAKAPEGGEKAAAPPGATAAPPTVAISDQAQPRVGGRRRRAP